MQHDDAQQNDPDQQNTGQVSEVAAFGDPDTPIAPEDATAGYPPSESGHPDEGPAGPNAVPEHGEERHRGDRGRDDVDDRPRDPADDPGRGPEVDGESPR